ncbi:hypothetical protein GCM10010344_14630 [Streptomyces bluensis]|nr:hypothetical protein GCM10010344_14630 [Streptomyces bluensis]
MGISLCGWGREFVEAGATSTNSRTAGPGKRPGRSGEYATGPRVPGPTGRTGLGSSPALPVRPWAPRATDPRPPGAAAHRGSPGRSGLLHTADQGLF